EIRRVEERVNQAILADAGVATEWASYREAVGRGAMALFGEKYGDVVRMVIVPDVSIELCGGTHVRHTGEIGLFRIVAETGVGSGVRRVEAVTGAMAYRRAVEREALLEEAAALARTPPDALPRRIEQLQEEARELRRRLERAQTEGSADRVGELLESAESVDGARVIARQVEGIGPDELRALGDGLRERLGTGAAVLAARIDERVALLAVVTDDLLSRGVRADRLIREIAALAGGSGGGRAHMAQGGASDPARVPAALERTSDLVRAMLAAS
ncbi:MAG TPA: DHHA1 domain-containing protein, partial [Longimicrobiales bacterium]|nr:DHHA1 domain-containing protein [Longimicrobiales bacterium]